MKRKHVQLRDLVYTITGLLRAPKEKCLQGPGTQSASNKHVHFNNAGVGLGASQVVKNPPADAGDIRDISLISM